MSTQHAFIANAPLGRTSLSRAPALSSHHAVATLADYVDENGAKVFIVKEGPGNLSTLIHHPELDEFNVFISKTLKLPICGWCNYSVEGKSLTNHLRLHKKSFKKPVSKKLEIVAQEVIRSIEGHSQPEFTNPSDGPHAPVQGLRVGKGLICKNNLETGKCCGIGMFSEASMKTHWRRNLCIIDGVGSYKEGYIQSVFNGNRRCFFEVSRVEEVGEVLESVEIEELCEVAARAIEKDTEGLTRLELPTI